MALRLPFLLAALLLAGCTQTVARQCRSHTARIRVNLGVDADAIDFAVTLGGAPQKHVTIDHPSGAPTIEVQFASYPEGQTLTLFVAATKNGVEVARIDGYTAPLQPGCSFIELALEGSDLGAGVDAGKTNGAACAPGDVCTSGHCVDGYCCDDVCTDPCEACDVDNNHGSCTPVTGTPHGARACAGDQTGPCAGSCDGTDATQCQYPTAACSAPSCTGGIATLAKLCSGGSCPSAAPQTQKCTLNCLGNVCLGVQQVAAGYSFACALLTDGTVRCFGDNTTGQIGQGAATDATAKFLTPQQVPGLANVQMLAATSSAICALGADHTIQCWGSNTSGELGRGGSPDLTLTKHSTPAAVVGINDATFIGGASGGHFCAVVTGGALKCWGNGASYQLGQGVSTTSSTPVSVCAPGSTALPCTTASGASYVAGGDNFTCAIFPFAANAVACWGDNSFAQVGRTATPTPSPFPVLMMPSFSATQLAAGNAMGCAASGGQAKCWGSNTADRLGAATMQIKVVPPLSVCTAADCSTTLMNVQKVTTYDESCCALAGGAVKCWGSNTGGQLGDGTTATAKASQGYAATTAISSGVVDITAGGQSHYAIVSDRADRYLLGWGTDGNGELGNDAVDGGTTTVPIAPRW
jgi:alpha-tubulin suppressor-like RCC1 family protein